MGVVLLIPLILLLLGQASAPAPASDPRFERLSNGMRVILIEDQSVPIVSAQLWTRVGWTADPPEQQGLCEATRQSLAERAPPLIELRARGVWVDSATLPDAHYFHLVAPRDTLESLLDALAARDGRATATLPVHTPAACAPDEDGVTRALRRRLFPAGPYSKRDGGPSTFPAADITEFERVWRAPESMTLLLIGDLSPPRALEAVRARFSCPWRAPQRRASLDLPKGERLSMDCGLPSDALRYSLLTPAIGDYLNAAVDVLLQRLLNRFDGPLAADLAGAGFTVASWRREEWRDAGVLELRLLDRVGSAGTPSERADRAGAMISGALERAIDEWPKPETLRRARALALQERLQKMASTTDRWRRWGELEVIGGDLLLNRFDTRQVEHVGVIDAQQAAMLLREARTVVAYGSKRAVSETPPSSKSLTSGDRPDAQPRARLSGVEGLGILASAGAARLSAPIFGPKATTHEAAGVQIEVLSHASPLWWTSIMSPGAPSEQRPSSDAGQREWQDFATYRSVSFVQGIGAARVTAPPASLLPALEALARRGLIRTGDRLRLVGELRDSDVKWLTRELPGFLAAAPAPTPTAGGWDSNSLGTLERLRLAPLRLQAPITTSVDVLAAAAVAWLTGPPRRWGLEIDSAREFRWTCDLQISGELVVTAGLGSDLSVEDAALRTHVAGLKELSDVSLMTALHHAQATRWQTLLFGEALLEQGAIERVAAPEQEILAAMRRALAGLPGDVR